MSRALVPGCLLVRSTGFLVPVVRERLGLMSGLEWFLGTTLAVLYLFLIFTVAPHHLPKGSLARLPRHHPALTVALRSRASGRERRYDERDRTLDAQHVTSHTSIV